MNFNKINRRTHLYLGLFLLPWVFVYGISSIPFSHNLNSLFDNGKPYFNQESMKETPYHLEIDPQADRRQVAERIMGDMGYDRAFGPGMPRENEFHVYLFSFWNQTRLIYYMDEGKVVSHDANFRWDRLLTSMHARGGYMQDRFLNDLWAFIVDLVSLAMVLWIISGVIVWWQTGNGRNWGFLSLGCGLLSFFLLLFNL